MEASVNYEHEWQDLQVKRQAIIEELNKRKNALNGFAEEKEITAMLAQKILLEKEVKDLQGNIHTCEDSICCGNFMIKNSYRVINGKLTKLEFYHAKKEFLKAAQYVMKKKRFCSEQITRLVNSIKESIAMSPEEIIARFTQWNADAERSKSSIKAIVLDKELCIERIRENFDQTKKYLEKIRQQKKQEKEDHHQAMLEWATRNRANRDWAIANQDVLGQSEIIQHYRQRFPDDDSVKFRTDTTLTQKDPTHVRQRKTEITKPPSVECNGQKARAWEFSVTVKPTDPGETISSKQEEFLRKIQPYLHGSIDGLDGELIYKKLVEPVTVNGAHPRQLNITQILDPRFRGWWRLGVSGDYRIMLFIDEKLCHIKFAPYKKGHEPYS